MAMSNGSDVEHTGDQWRRIYFPVVQDADGYPPIGGETLWATALGVGRYRLENVPFFAKGVSFGDIVTADLLDGTPTFGHVLERGGHRTIRVVVSDPDDLGKVRNELARIGADTEKSHLRSMISVDIPPSISLDEVRRFLDRAATENGLEYEESDIDPGVSP